MRAANRLLMLVLAALIGAVMVRVALWEQAGLRAAEEAAAALQTQTPAPTPTPDSALLGKLLITELMEKNRTVLMDEDGEFSDWIELTNVSGETVALTGCRIADRESRWGWTFPERSLAPGERLVVFASRKDRRGDELHTDFARSGSVGVVIVHPLHRESLQRMCGGKSTTAPHLGQTYL